MARAKRAAGAGSRDGRARGRASKKSAKRPAPGPESNRRRRLLDGARGRDLDEAYLNDRALRAEIEAEAADPDPDSLVTPDMLEHLNELIEEKRRVVAAAPILPAGARALRESGPSGPGQLGARVLEELSAPPPVPGEEMPVPRASRARGAGAGIEFYAAPRLFFSSDQVVFVPGFLASTLSDTVPSGLGLIWVDPLLSFRDELGALQLGPYDGLERDLNPAVRINAVGPLPYFYDWLRLALEVRRYTVEVFPVDWRKDLEIAAGMLAARLRALAGQSRRPIHLIAHSQGAMVARRAVQLLGRAEARRILKHLVLLGPANFGSFSSVLGLAGNHSLMPMIRKVAIDPRQGFRTVLASMSGLYQLVPFDADRVPWLRANDYSRPEFWKQPVDDVRLSRFYGWGGTIDASFLNDRTTVILADNHGQPTTGGVVYRGALLVDDPAFGLAGDGTVPHSCSVLPGTKTYLAPGTEHSMMATDRRVIDAVRDILVDRAVGLDEVSSNPSDHLAPLVGASRGLAAPGVRPATRGTARPKRKASRS